MIDPDEKFSVILTRAEIDLVVGGLNLRRNFIETGNPCLGAADLGARCEPSDGASLRSLSTDQMRLIVKQEDLAKRLLTLLTSPNPRR